MRLALVTTPPSQPCGIADSTCRLLPHLAQHAEVELFVAPGLEGQELAGLPTRSSAELWPREFDQIVYQLGNVREHAFMVPLVRAFGGAVVLHDWVLFDLALAAFPALARGGPAGHLAALREGGLKQARVYLEHWREHRRARSRPLVPSAAETLDPAADAALRPSVPQLSQRRFGLAFNRSIVRFADAFVVHSEHVARRIRAERNAPTPVGLVQHGAEPGWSSEDRRLERERLGLAAPWREAFLLTSFGALQAHKRLDVLLEALANARRSRADMRLALIGAEHASELDVRSLVRRLGLEHAVHFTGHLPEQEARRWIHAGDLAVQLRGPSTGRTSGALFQALALGRGVIASALDEQRELPDECVYKLHPGEGEAARLAHKLVDLRDAPAVRAAMERAARDFIEQRCRWERVAERYAELLGRFPRPRASRRSLWALRLERAGREGWERGRAGAGPHGSR